MPRRSIWMAFIDTLAAIFVPFGVVTRPKPYRNPSWWPV